MTTIDLIFQMIKFPFVCRFKTVFTVLNIIPLPVYELHGHPGHGTENLARRAIHTKIKGHRRVHLGTLLMAFVRGQLIKAEITPKGFHCWGVFDEDLMDIQKKWIW